ncbi:glycine/sarcosine/betaine reductase selenoprotein B family protein [Chloroflexota bacterium]
MLWKIGQVFDDSDFSRVIEHVVDGQIQAYARPGTWKYEEAPFTPLAKPLSESRLALITSTGHFIAGEDPEPFGVKDMTQEEAVRRINDFLKAEPTLTAIPMDIPNDQLRVRHGGYDIRGVQADRNVGLPLDHLREFADQGLIGDLLPDAYSFVGAAAQLSSSTTLAQNG